MSQSLDAGVDGLDASNDVVGDSSVLQGLQRVGLEEIVRPWTAACAAEIVLTDVHPPAVLTIRALPILSHTVVVGVTHLGRRP